jgi:hypothetical protein
MTTATLLRVLVRRELKAWWSAVLLLMSVAAVWSALQPLDFAAGHILARLLRRGDLALIALTTVVAAGHVAQRVTADRSLRWLEPWAAASGDVRRYLLSLIVAVSLTRWLWIAAATVSFAAAARVNTGSAELLTAAPALLARAALLLLCIAAFAALCALLVRDAIAALLLATLATMAPLIAASIHQFRASGESIPLPLHVWVVCCTPPVQLANGLHSVIADGVWLLAALLLAAAVSRRIIGRHA